MGGLQGRIEDLERRLEAMASEKATLEQQGELTELRERLIRVEEQGRQTTTTKVGGQAKDRLLVANGTRNAAALAGEPAVDSGKRGCHLRARSNALGTSLGR